MSNVEDTSSSRFALEYWTEVTPASVKEAVDQEKRHINWLPWIGILLALPGSFTYVGNWFWNSQRLSAVAHAFSAPVNPDYATLFKSFRDLRSGWYDPFFQELRSSNSKEVKDKAPDLAMSLSNMVESRIPTDVPYGSNETILRLTITNNSQRIFHKLIVRVDRANLFSVQRNQETEEVLHKDGRIDLGDVSPKDQLRVFAWGGIPLLNFFSVNTEEGPADIKFVSDTDFESPSATETFVQSLLVSGIVMGVVLILFYIVGAIISRYESRARSSK